MNENSYRSRAQTLILWIGPQKSLKNQSLLTEPGGFGRSESGYSQERVWTPLLGPPKPPWRPPFLGGSGPPFLGTPPLGPPKKGSKNRFWTPRKPGPPPKVPNRRRRKIVLEGPRGRLYQGERVSKTIRTPVFSKK